jgi:hypothetical protein
MERQRAEGFRDRAINLLRHVPEIGAEHRCDGLGDEQLAALGEDAQASAYAGRGTLDGA